ncbi:MAG: STAS domain-containing protein [Pseudomonadota bacterium]
MADYSLTYEENARVLEVTGPLEQSDAGQFREALERATSDKTAAPVIIDLSGLELIGSAAMRLLAQFTKLMAERGATMITVGVSGVVRELIEMCGMDALLKIEQSTDDALAGLTPA